MWLFPWNAGSDFNSQYNISDEITSLSDKSIWSFFEAKRRSSGEAVTILRHDIRDPPNKPSESTELARQSLKRIKTLRHPCILKYVDSYESEKSVVIVTEPVVPLVDYLYEGIKSFAQAQKDFSVAYGLSSVAKGLEFLNTSCQLNHNNINIYSIFVNLSGEWKIGGLDYVCSVDEKPPELHTGLDQKYNPPERIDPARARHPGGKFAPDSWGMGCLVWECFNKPITPNSNVKTIGHMPKPLSVHYNKLVQSSPKHRISPATFIEVCRSENVFFNLPSLDTIIYLEQIQLVKDPNEKAKFFSRLISQLDLFPPDVCKNKILPDLINAFEYCEAGSSILDPIFKIGKMLKEEEYQRKLVPCIVKLYMRKDRAIRSKLLQQLDSYIHFLSSNVINEQVFPQVVQGFLDSNPTIKEQTVKSMVLLAPKLNESNLNEELLKHLARVQTRDEHGGIRTCTTVCLGKIAKHLSSEMQSLMLIPTLLKAMCDSFAPTRHAAIAGIIANETLFTTKDCATKIMPALCNLCIDPDEPVRKLAFKTLKLFTVNVEVQTDKDAADDELSSKENNQDANSEVQDTIERDMKAMSMRKH